MAARLVPTFPCTDLRAALAFWSSLGFTTAPGAHDGPTPLRHPCGAELRLVSAATPSAAEVTLVLDSAVLVDRLLSDWAGVAAAAIRAPSDTDDGFRRGSVTDPSGNVLVVEGPREAPPTWTGLYIDTPAVDDDGIAFWERAFQREVVDDDGTYAVLAGTTEFDIEIQRIGEPTSRFHIDFSVDDVDEAADRFESYGAVRIDRIEGWWVMRAPTGQVFCLVPR